MTSAVSISEAARLTGKNRRTLHRHIEAGRLSVSHDGTGAPQVEIVELLRVYGPLKQAPVSQSAPEAQSEAVSQKATPNNEAVPHVPHPDTLELVTLRAEVNKLQALLEAKDQHIASLDRALLAIEHTNKTAHPAPVTPETDAKKAPRRGLARWIFGAD